jgi:hypothetical protein
MSLLSDDKECGCGISKIFMTSTKDPLTPACLVHDQFYEYKPCTRLQADQSFLREALAIARQKNSLLIKGQAYVYYGFIRAFGWLWW